MTIYVVYADYDMEGYGEPEGVFLSRDEADKFAEKAQSDGIAPRKVMEFAVVVSP